MVNLRTNGYTSIMYFIIHASCLTSKSKGLPGSLQREGPANVTRTSDGDEVKGRTQFRNI